MLRYAAGFCALAEELHFGRAAARLHVTQPALSYQLKMMEQAVGCQLVQRSSHGVALTEAGAALARELTIALAQLGRARTAAIDIARGEAGALTIGYCELPWGGNLSGIIPAYAARYPGVHVSLRALSTNGQVAGLLDGSVDVGFLHPPVDTDALCLRPAGEEPMVAAMLPGHRLAGRDGLRIADLAGERLIFCSAASAPRLHRAVVDGCAQAGFVPRVSTEADSWHAMAAEAAAGLGIALVPETLRDSFGGGIVFRPLTDLDWRLQTAIATTAGQRRPAVVRFLEVAEGLLFEKRSKNFCQAVAPSN